MTTVATWSSKMCSFGLKGTADPLLCQDPRTVLPSYASLMDTEPSNDFRDNELMTSNHLYSLYLLRGDAVGTPGGIPDDKPKSEEPVNGERHHGGIDAKDALFEGMPFFELKTKEVGPCAYCNMWSPVRFMSYCGKFPFCSVYCTKKFAVYKRDLGELSEMPSTQLDWKGKMKVPTLFEDNKPKPLFPSNQQRSPPKGRIFTAKTLQSKPHCPTDATPPFDWSTYLENANAEAAPVRCFKQAPLNSEWKSSLLGAMLEVQTKNEIDSPDTFWVARIIQIAGYRARLRFEGYGIDSSRDFWIHLCTTESFPINGAVRVGKKLKPPKEVMDRLGDSWLEHISKVAHAGSLTISVPIEKVKQGLSCPFKKGMKLEAVYKRQLSHTCVAKVINVVADRIHVQYENCKEPSKDFWFHHTSTWIHPVGWSQRVGHCIIASAAFKSEALDKGRHKRTGPGDAPWDLFSMPEAIEGHGFKVGLKMEAVDPLKLGNICVATVMEVLEEGYLMIAIDGCMGDKSSWFCYHVTSPFLLPGGFCEHHKIPIVPPIGYENKFDWVDYLKETQSTAAPVELFSQDIKDRGFRPGQKVEAVDLIEPGLICVATIVKIAGSLLSIHFDGWEGSFDQWTNSESSNIYPVGWCEMVGYPLQAPKISEAVCSSNGGLNKSFKKSSRHSPEKKRKLESGGKLSAVGFPRKSLGSKKIKDKLSVKKKITPDIYWKHTGQDRVPSLDELEKMPAMPPTRGKDLSKVESLVGCKYSFDSSGEHRAVKPKLSMPVACTSEIKEKKKRLKKSKKEKRERKREKKKKEKKRSKDKSHRKKNKHKQNGLSKLGAVKGVVYNKVPQVTPVSQDRIVEENYSVDVVSTDRHSEDAKVTPKLEPLKLPVSKEARNSNVYFVSESTRPKFESMFGDRQGFVFEKKKVCAVKERDHKKTMDFGEHDPYSLEAEFPSEKEKDTLITGRVKLKVKSLHESLEDVLKQTGKYADSIKVTNSPEYKGKGIKSLNGSTSPSNTNVIPPNSQSSVLDSPISLSSTQSTSSTGNIPATSKSDSNLSPVHQKVDLSSNATPSSCGEDGTAHQKVDLSSLPTPSSCGEEMMDDVQQPVIIKEEQSFDDGDVNDLMDIIENDLATLTAARNPSDRPKAILTNVTPEKVQSEMDADRKVEEILRAIRERSGQSTTALKEENPVLPIERQTGIDNQPPKRKQRSRSKSADKTTAAKKAAKTRKSHLASLLQRPGRLNLNSGEVPFYLEGNFPSGIATIVTPPKLTLTARVPPSPVHPTDRSNQGINSDGTTKSSLLVEMLNNISNQQEKSGTMGTSRSAGTTPVRQKTFEVTNLKRPSNLQFSPGPMSPPRFPPMSPSSQAAVLMELVRTPKAPSSNPQSPALSPQFNGSILPPGHSYPNPMEQLKFLQRSVPQQSNVPNQRLSPWLNPDQYNTTVSSSMPQPISSRSPSPQLIQKAPFRFPDRFTASSSVSTPQRLPPMQTLLRGLQCSMLPKSPPSPAVPLSPQMSLSSPYQLPSTGTFNKSFQQSSPELPSLSMTHNPHYPQISEGSTTSNSKISKNTTQIKTNPWFWGVPEVMQFLCDAGEGACADTFYRQQIDGQKLMSLNKEQIAKLTGMKVASSIKIYQQVSKLQSMFPPPLSPEGSQGLNS